MSRTSGKPAMFGRWNEFWFRPRSTSTLGLVRIAFGLVLFAWTLTLTLDLIPFYSTSGILPGVVEDRWAWSVFDIWSSNLAVVTVFTLLLLASVCLVLGYRSRVASLVAFVALLSFQRRNPYVLNSGDWLLRILAFYLVLTPCGAALSLDRWRRDRDAFWTSPPRAPWGLRLIQIQLSAVYLFAVWAKVQGQHWNDGTAVSYAWRIGDFLRIHVLPAAITQSALVSSVVTYGTLAVELSIAFLVWNRRARPWVLAAGLILHLGIDATLLIGFFTFELLIAYISFIPEDSLDRWLLRLRGRLDTRDRSLGAHRVAVPIARADQDPALT